MGGAAAWLAGRAIAATWRPWWHLALYMLPLSLAVRFLHSALFEGKFLSLHYYLVDYAVCFAFGLLGFHLTQHFLRLRLESPPRTARARGRGALTRVIQG